MNRRSDTIQKCLNNFALRIWIFCFKSHEADSSRLVRSFINSDISCAILEIAKNCSRGCRGERFDNHKIRSRISCM